MKSQKAIIIKNHRINCKKRDTKELQQKRMKFLSKLQTWTTELPFEIFEMYPTKEGVIKSKKLYAQYLNECKFANTRKKLLSETCLEIDKIDFDKAFTIITEVCASLMRSKIHFVVFLAEGGRSPYIMIYDFEELINLTPFQRIKAQIQFWRKHVPFGTFQYVDTGMFADEHLRPLEFSIHWKHKTPFNIIIEYNPYPKLSYKEISIGKKLLAKKYQEKSKCKV